MKLPLGSTKLLARGVRLVSGRSFDIKYGTYRLGSFSSEDGADRFSPRCAIEFPIVRGSFGAEMAVVPKAAPMRRKRTDSPR